MSDIDVHYNIHIKKIIRENIKFYKILLIKLFYNVYR